MAGKFYTLMILPESTGQMRKHRIPKSLVKGAVASVVVLVCVAAGFVYSYVQLNQKAVRLEEYRQGYNQQRVHLQILEKTVGKFKKELTDLTKSNRKFRIMVGLPEGKGLQQVSGIGGEGEGATFQEFIQQCEDALLKKLYADLEQIKLDISQEQNNLQEITETVKDKTSLLTSTPSIRPTSGWMTSGFGYRRSPFTGRREMHKGLDIASRFGTPIVAPADGIVTYAGRKGSLGKVVVLEHGYGYSTRFGHISKLLVRVGEHIKRGQIVAKVGTTGRSTAPHLHYEVRLNGVAVNPYNYILN